MDSFKNVYNALQKEYSFVVRVASRDKINSDAITDIEHALKKYDIKDLKNVSSTPIIPSHQAFPNLKNFVVNRFEVVTSYPASPDLISNLVTQVLARHSSYSVVVFTSSFDEQAAVEDEPKESKEEYKAKLGSDLADDKESKDIKVEYGSDHVKEVVKKAKSADPAKKNMKLADEEKPGNTKSVLTKEFKK